MSNEKSGIKGKVDWVLTGPDGTVKDRGVEYNLITDVGDALYGSRAIAGINSNGVTADTQPTGMKLGEGTTAAAKNGAGAALVTYITGSNKAFDATFPTESQSAGAGYVATYKRTYAAGEATNASINEAVIVTESIANDDTSTAAETISRVVFASTINKGASDTLTVTWTHTLLGA